jgi:tetratricopeptide (TPR) repeat protein
VYTLAIANEEKKAWRDSYDAFRVYSETYPNGILVAEAHEHSTVDLISLVKAEIDQKKYVEAIGNLNLISAAYKDTKVAAETASLTPEVYTAWGTDLRVAGDFVGAERIFNDLKAWLQANQKAELTTTIQHELAETYLEWGLDLQSQKQFENAKSKLDLAISTDPESQSDGGIAVRAKTSLGNLYTQWGNQLIEQKDFTGAMEKYETLAAMSESRDPASANDSIANGYIQWASGLTAEEDYLGALVLLDFAQTRATTDSTKALVDSTRSDLYLAFSKSDGEQARKAMQDAVRIVCEHHIQPRLPIFGLDQENIRAGVDGADDQLPESVAAMTPASLHYVACIEQDSRVVGTLRLPISTTQFGGPLGVVQIDYNNLQYIWDVVLREIDNGDEKSTTVIEGDEPPILIPYNIEIHTFNYFGPKPNIADLADWILSVIK